jgi:hypothetical protein
MKEDFTDDKKSLLEDYLNDAVRYEGIDGESTACANFHFGRFHHCIIDTLSCNDKKRNHLQLAESYYKEASRIITKKHGPNDPNALWITSKLSEVSILLGQIGNHHPTEEL